MGDVSWTQLIKKIAKEERITSRPCTTVTGKVMSVSPIKVAIGQQIVLTNGFITVPDSYKDYEVEIQTEDGVLIGVIHNALKKGDKVILIQQDGGQKYTVIGRVKNGS